jgi:hypothetical protein
MYVPLSPDAIMLVSYINALNWSQEGVIYSLSGMTVLSRVFLVAQTPGRCVYACIAWAASSLVAALHEASFYLGRCRRFTAAIPFPGWM